MIKFWGLNWVQMTISQRPYNPLEVVARVKAQLRRCYAYQEQKSEKTEVLKALDLVMHPAEGALFRNGAAITLTATEFKILELFMRTPGRIYTKQQTFFICVG